MAAPGLRNDLSQPTSCSSFSDNAIKLLQERYLRRDDSGTLTENPDGMLQRVAHAVPLMEHLASKGIQLHLGDGLARIEAHDGGGLVVVADSGARLSADLVILAIGVRPETKLAKDAGLELGPRGGVVVDAQMRTSDPNLWAVGDVVEVHDLVTGQETVLPLAGPANRQGRVAAESIAGRKTHFRGVQTTAVVGMLGITVASTGASEKGLRRAGVTNFEKIYLHPGHHAGYYPGAQQIHLKLVFSAPDGRILGAQAVGYEGAEKRIDVIATAIQFNGTVHDLAEAELCYAPQFGAAKDPVNLAGMLAENVLNGDMAVADWLELGRTEALLLDVREGDEFSRGTYPRRSTCRSHSCVPVTSSCQRIATPGSTARWDSAPTSPRDS
jgi:hypothetical protein